MKQESLTTVSHAPHRSFEGLPDAVTIEEVKPGLEGAQFRPWRILSREGNKRTPRNGKTRGTSPPRVFVSPMSAV